MTKSERRWPAEGVARVPYWVYSDNDLYEGEQEHIFRGATWSFLCLEAELPKPNSYRRSAAGAMPVVVTRDGEGRLHAFENRCAHRGSLLCINERGDARNIVCIYHNWSYDLAGNLTGVAFRRGLGGKGGMPPDATARKRMRRASCGWKRSPASSSEHCRPQRRRSKNISERNSSRRSDG